MAEEQEARFIAPIHIHYSGLDANRNRIDMAQLGQSLQGAARLIGVASHIAIHAEYVNRTPSLAFRVMTEPARPGSYSVWAVLQTIIPALPLVLEVPPADLVEKIVNYILSRLAGTPQDDKALELLGRSIEANREAMAANRDIALAAIQSTEEATKQMGKVALAAIEAVRDA
ncbi:hypothetical protein, partial [Devosia sp.]|uniref:DUF7946 domain-containing protein n=1 Tax=Devosia sp. TaxID=1871048 RepID=UPI002636B381